MLPDKNELSDVLYNFLESIYLFQQIELNLFHVTWQEIYLLKILHDQGAIHIGGAAEALRIPLFAASRIVTRLEKLGHLTKSRLPDNRRVIQIEATQQGKQTLADVEAYQYQLISSNAHVLEPSEMQAIITGLSKLKQLLSITRGA